MGVPPSSFVEPSPALSAKTPADHLATAVSLAVLAVSLPAAIEAASRAVLLLGHATWPALSSPGLDLAAVGSLARAGVAPVLRLILWALVGLSLPVWLLALLHRPLRARVPWLFVPVDPPRWLPLATALVWFLAALLFLPTWLSLAQPPTQATFPTAVRCLAQVLGVAAAIEACQALLLPAR